MYPVLLHLSYLFLEPLITYFQQQRSGLHVQCQMHTADLSIPCRGVNTPIHGDAMPNEVC